MCEFATVWMWDVWVCNCLNVGCVRLRLFECGMWEVATRPAHRLPTLNFIVTSSVPTQQPVTSTSIRLRPSPSRYIKIHHRLQSDTQRSNVNNQYIIARVMQTANRYSLVGCLVASRYAHASESYLLSTAYTNTLHYLSTAGISFMFFLVNLRMTTSIKFVWFRNILPLNLCSFSSHYAFSQISYRFYSFFLCFFLS